MTNINLIIPDSDMARMLKEQREYYYECGCELSDLQPCDLDFARRKPGYKGAAKDPSLDFYIYESKEYAEAANKDQES